MAKKDKSARKATKVKGAGKKGQKKGDKKGKKQSKALAPKPVKQGKGLSPMELGNAVVRAINAGRPDAELWAAHWSPKAVSIEGMGVNMAWEGRKAIAAKSEEWMRTHKIHSASAEGPYVGATGFSIKFTMDVEDTTSGSRVVMSEVGVYTVKSGKVICEEFMYGVG